MAAIDLALQLAVEPSAVKVLHVLPELSATEPGVVWDTIDNESRCTHALEALRDQLSHPKYQQLQLGCLVGDPGHAIADEAKKRNADLIVMPSHGRRGLSRLLLGSVAERVLRLARCNVLILKPKFE